MPAEPVVEPPELAANRAEKQWVALSSVGAAVLLAVLKVSAGLQTGSLGLLAEAAHSGLDLVAALMTLFAVRLADRPPDLSHPYGHGKFENLSAFFESGLLLVTAAWIIYEAVQRLLFYPVEIEPSIWAFGVMGLSIVVNYSRSRALAHAARKHRSQALEADALHFGTDIWSSAVVLLGLTLVSLSGLIGEASLLARADAAAALIVAMVVIWVGGRMALATVDALVDRAPEEESQRLAEAAASVRGVAECRRVRLRRSGAKLFADLVVSVARTTTFAQAHLISEAVEERVRAVVPDADVVVHVEPVPSESETAAEQIHFVARQLGLRAHDVRVREVDGQLEADLHVEVDPDLPLRRAHAVASRLERQVGEANPIIRGVHTHLEAPGSRVERRDEVTVSHESLVARVKAVANEVTGPGSCHEVRVYQGGDETTGPHDLVLHVSFPGHLPIREVHVRSAEVERALRLVVPRLGTVLVHAEPQRP